MTHQLGSRISDSLWQALQREVERTGHSLSHVVQRALSESLGIEHHSLFQVSTTGAVVKGIFQGCNTVGDLKEHGDFGLGTFEGLDGELVMLDGRCYQAITDGVIGEARDSWRVPFATVTRFSTDQSATVGAIDEIGTLYKQLDNLRPSENIFVGLRIDGLFKHIDMRAACKAAPGEDLISATSHQSEYSLKNIRGTLVGFWTPTFAKAINVAGYHVHFISDDRKFGGHVLGVKAAQLSVAMHFETDFHVAIPETQAFLKADLQDDPSAAIEVAEKGSVRDR
jgi:acetolactate decarboxylase